MGGFLQPPEPQPNRVPPDIARLGNATGHLRNIIPAATAVTFPIAAGDYSDQPTTSGAVFRWELYDSTTGTLVTSAQASPGGHVIAAGGTWTCPPLPAGAYHWWAFRETSIDFWGTYQGDSTFVVYADATGLPNPAWDSPLSGPGGRDDAALLLRVGLPFIRQGVYLHEVLGGFSTEDSYHTVNAATNALLDSIGYTGHRLLVITDYQIGDEAAVTAILNRPQYAAITHAGPTNEPDGYVRATYVSTQHSFWGAVKAATVPRAVLLAGSVQMGPNAVEAGLQPALEAGLAQWFDCWDTHLYPGEQGDAASHRTKPGQPGYLGAFEACIAAWDSAHGTNLSARPRFSSEGGTFQAAEYGGAFPNRQAVDIVAQLRWLAPHGISQDHYAWFYGRASGFPDYSSWLTTSTFTSYGGGIIPNTYAAAGLTMARAVQLRDPAGGLRAWQSVLDCGAEDFVMVANVYGGTDGTRVIDWQSVGPRTVTLTLQLAGTVPSTLTTANGWGTTTTATVTGGRATVTVDRFGGYVRLPAGCTATVVNDAPVVDPDEIGIATNGSTGLTALRSPLDPAVRLSSLVYDVANVNSPLTPLRQLTAWPDGTPDTPPTVTLTLPTVMAPQRLQVQCMPAWQTQSVILRANVRDASGTVVGTIDELSTIRALPRISLAYGCWFVCYWDGAHAFNVDLTGPATGQLVLEVEQLTRGGSPNTDTSTGFGLAPLTFGGSAVDLTYDDNVLGAGFSSPSRLLVQGLQVQALAVPSGVPSGPFRYLVRRAGPVPTPPSTGVTPLVEEFA